MIDNKITIVTSSRSIESEKSEFLDNINNTCGIDYELKFFHNSDGRSLTSIYSEVIENCSTDIIIFIHDDIEFYSNNWGLDIVNLFKMNKEYGIIGIAGSAEFDENAAWWNYNNKYGQVVHRKDGKVWLTEFSGELGDKLEEVCVIDGLFMAVEKNRITRNFDTEFSGFNHYDTSFCIDNYLDEECKIGVTTKIKVIHSSIGELKQEWADNKIKLINKFGEYFPIIIKKKKNGKRT